MRCGGEQCAALLERQGFRIAVFRDTCVARLVGDVRPIASVEHLDVVDAEVLDGTVGVGHLLGGDHLAGALEGDRVRVVFDLQRGVLGAVLDVRTEASDVRLKRLTLDVVTELARQLEELHRVVEVDGVHLLAGTQTCEARLVGVFTGADLDERTEAAHPHRDRLAARRVGADLARLRCLVARDGLLDLLHLVDEGLPELPQGFDPRLFAA